MFKEEGFGKRKTMLKRIMISTRFIKKVVFLENNEREGKFRNYPLRINRV
jgi:hypothetical protein